MTLYISHLKHWNVKWAYSPWIWTNLHIQWMHNTMDFMLWILECYIYYGIRVSLSFEAGLALVARTSPQEVTDFLSHQRLWASNLLTLTPCRRTQQALLHWPSWVFWIWWLYLCRFWRWWSTICRFRCWCRSRSLCFHHGVTLKSVCCSAAIRLDTCWPSKWAIHFALWSAICCRRYLGAFCPLDSRCCFHGTFWAIFEWFFCVDSWAESAAHCLWPRDGSWRSITFTLTLCVRRRHSVNLQLRCAISEWLAPGRWDRRCRRI